METVTIRSRGFPILEVMLDDDGQAAEMVERDEGGDVIRRWESAAATSRPPTLGAEER